MEAERDKDTEKEMEKEKRKKESGCVCVDGLVERRGGELYKSSLLLLYEAMALRQCPISKPKKNKKNKEPTDSASNISPYIYFKNAALKVR